MTRYYKEENGQPIEVSWGAHCDWMMANPTMLGRDVIGSASITTYFEGIDHGVDDPPRPYVSVTTRPYGNRSIARMVSREQALSYHARTVVSLYRTQGLAVPGEPTMQRPELWTAAQLAWLAHVDATMAAWFAKMRHA